MALTKLYPLAKTLGVKPRLLADVLGIQGRVSPATEVEGDGSSEKLAAYLAAQEAKTVSAQQSVPPEGSPAWVCNDCRATHDPLKRLCSCSVASARIVNDPRINPRTKKPISRPWAARNTDLKGFSSGDSSILPKAIVVLAVVIAFAAIRSESGKKPEGA